MRTWNVTHVLVIAWFVLGVSAGPVSAQGGANIIRPGREGKFVVTASKTIKTPTRAIGTLAGYDITEIDSPSVMSGMGKMMALDSKGYIWYVESREDREVRIDPRTLEVTYYQLPAGSAPYSIAIDKNDTHWLTAHGIEMLIESHPEEGYCISRQPPSRGFLIHINVHQPSGTVWFSQPGNNQVVSFKPGEGFKEYPLPGSQAGPGRLDFDRDGNLWVPELYVSRIARLDTSTGTGASGICRPKTRCLPSAAWTRTAPCGSRSLRSTRLHASRMASSRSSRSRRSAAWCRRTSPIARAGSGSPRGAGVAAPAETRSLSSSRTPSASSNLSCRRSRRSPTAS